MAKEKNRIYGLDILRCCAIMFVVIGHGNNLLPGRMKEWMGNIFGYDGVSIFFVLSGFLIGGILVKMIDKNQTINRKNLLQFWIRRWFRTLPNYFFILVLLCIPASFSIDGFFVLRCKKYFLFLQNLFKPHPNFFPEAWSLCVEEWFYLLIPLLIAFYLKVCKFSPEKSIVSGTLTVIIAVTLFRYYRFSTVLLPNLYYWDIWLRKTVITRLDSLMFGVIGAYLHYCYYENWIKHKKTLFSAGIFLFVFVKIMFNLHIISYTGFYNAVLSFSVTSLATLMLLPFLNDYKTGKDIVYRLVTRISLISYSMYLLNLSVVQLIIINHIPFSSFLSSKYVIFAAKYMLYWVLVIGLSSLLYKYWEAPMMKLRDNRTVKKLLRIY